MEDTAKGTILDFRLHVNYLPPSSSLEWCVTVVQLIFSPLWAVHILSCNLLYIVHSTHDTLHTVQSESSIDVVHSPHTQQYVTLCHVPTFYRLYKQ